MILLTTMAFAEGQQEEEKPLIFAIEGDGENAKLYDGWLYKDNIIPAFEAATGIKIELREYTSVVDSTTQSLDMDLASNESSDVIMNYAGRVNKYANPDFGINLYEALPKDFTNQFKESALAQFERDGKLYALPMPGWATCLIVNVDLFEQAGVADVLPADEDLDRSWTLAEFDRAVKAISALGDDYYGYYIIAKEAGGDYWIFNMLGGFGAKLYENGRVALNTPEGIEGMEYIHYLHEKGYVPFGASALGDYDMGALYFSGKLGMRGYVPGGVTAGEAVVKDGIAAKTFKSILMEYPHKEGIGITGVAPCFGPDAIMIIDNGDPEQIKKAAKFLEHVAGAEVQTFLQKVSNKFSPLKTAGPPEGQDRAGEAMRQMAQIIKKNGIYDMGIGLPVYNELRQVWLAIMQGMLTNAITPEQAVAEFEERGNKLLSE